MSMSGMDSHFSLDKMMKDMPKMFRLGDDMHELTSYINDMRIMMIFLIVASALGGLVFLIYRHKKSSKKAYRLTEIKNKDGSDDVDSDGERGWTKAAAQHGQGAGKNGQFKKLDGNGAGVMNV